jgi:hypothetical protein
LVVIFAGAADSASFFHWTSQFLAFGVPN